jgi:hypothetical protein
MNDATAAAKTPDPAMFYNHPLYKLLDASFPDLRTNQGIFDVKAFAKSIEMSDEGVYKWLRSGKMSVAGARKTIEASNGRLVPQELFAFVMG